jgi:hypothetical protein
MMTDLTDEVVDHVLAKVRAGDVPEDIARAAATNDIETADILELMIARDLERRVQAGEVIAHVGADGETYYERADD